MQPLQASCFRNLSWGFSKRTCVSQHLGTFVETHNCTTLFHGQGMSSTSNRGILWFMLWAHSTLPKPCSSNTHAKTYENIQKQYCWKDVDNVDKKVREELSAWSFNSNPIDPPGTFPSPWTAGNRFSATASAATRAPPRAVAWPCRGLRRTPLRLRGL